MLDAVDIAAVAGASLAAGALNAVAGGGSLITFPTLVAIGLPPIAASITNTVALCPGYLGAAVAQRHELAGQGRRIALLLPVSVVGALAGAWILLHTHDDSFDALVPFLLLLAALLVGAQEPIRRWLFGRDSSARSDAWAIIPVVLASAYGGYFGAGMGVMMVAALGIVLRESLIRLNALKQLVTLTANVTAALAFLASGRIDWPIVAIMAGGALTGGAIGGRLASRLPARALRTVIVVFGVSLAAVYFIR